MRERTTRRLSAVPALLLALSATVAAEEPCLEGRFRAQELEEREALTDARVELTRGDAYTRAEYRADVETGGDFAFYKVAPGRYTLRLVSGQRILKVLKVEVQAHRTRLAEISIDG